MGKMTRTRRALIAADMARILRELQQTSVEVPEKPRLRSPRPAGPSLIVRGK